MKKILITALVAILSVSYGFAQCKKNLRLVSDTTSFVDQSGGIMNSKQEDVVVEITDSAIDVKISQDGMQRDNLTGSVRVTSCQWKVPFKEGKTVFQTTLKDQGGDSRNAVLTIEGKGGRVSFLLEPQGTNEKRIRLSIKKFEEKK